MSKMLRLLLPAMGLMLCGCWPVPDQLWWQRSWKAEVDHQTSQFGYRNWIVIAESSFPALNREGLRQVNAQAEVPEVADYVLHALERTESVRPQIYLARELRSVENDFAPGIDELRKLLKTSLHGHETTEIDQQSLMTLLRETQKHYEVLVVRTQSTLPYSSVFLELRPGYWDAESEDRLRERIQEERMQRLVRPMP